MKLSPLNQRRWQNFRANKRAFWSLRIFLVLFGLSLFAEFIANDKPLLVQYRGEYYTPIFSFYPETAFGGDFQTEAIYRDIEVKCLIITGGQDACFDDPDAMIQDAQDSMIGDTAIAKGWMIWPLIPYSYDTPNNLNRPAPSPPDRNHWLGTDDTTRDLAARVIYGFRLSVVYAFVVIGASLVLGVIAGAIMGYFGGVVDLAFQRILEVFESIPTIYVLIILVSIFGRSFTLLVILSIIFGWPAFTGFVRAEFLRARNFEYVRAAQALGVPNRTVMFRHILPNAMVGTLTLLPFAITGAIGALATLDFLGFGLPSASASLGEITRQAKENIQVPFIIFVAITTFAIMLSLLVFIFEGVRDAFDPRKVFS